MSALTMLVQNLGNQAYILHREGLKKWNFPSEVGGLGPLFIFCLFFLFTSGDCKKVSLF